ncbi:MAG: hypothetical protein M1825_000832 [Sarcosagium campestre]|nr:MAG: hypothetical protein M1825_000832 [Sarcosagium campestre]
MADEEDDTESPFFSISEDLVPSRPARVSSTSHLDFEGLLSFQPLQLHQDSGPGCGGQAWPSGMVMARHLLGTLDPEELKGQTVVELGAGGGLVGLALALHSPKTTVHITDLPSMLPLLQLNVTLNKLESRVQASVLSWGDPIPSWIPKNPSMILAADCTYHEPAFPLLLSTLLALSSGADIDSIQDNEKVNITKNNNGDGTTAVIYLGWKKRRHADLRFLAMVRKLFQLREISRGREGVQDEAGVIL